MILINNVRTGMIIRTFITLRHGKEDYILEVLFQALLSALASRKALLQHVHAFNTIDILGLVSTIHGLQGIVSLSTDNP
jgi:hypothetical protein